MNHYEKHTIRQNRIGPSMAVAALLVPALLALTSTGAAAQGVLRACYTGTAGVVYVIGQPGLSDQCRSRRHAEFSLTGVEFDLTNDAGEASVRALRAGGGPFQSGVPSQSWSLFGNSRSDATKDKLGTTDFVDLVLVTDNKEALRITAAGEIKLKNSLEIGKDLTVGHNVFLNTVGGETINHGNFTVANESSTQLTGQVTIDASVAGGDASFDAYPLRVAGSDQGVAIKVNGSRSNANNFVTFFDDNGIQGRIEGQTAAELATDPEYIFQNAVLVAQEVIAIADEVAALSSSTVGATTTVPPIPVVTSPVPSLIAQATANLIIQSAQIVAFNAFKQAQIGVTYQSSAGDYAEWLAKANVADEFHPGDIVGVRGGLISSNTDGAEQVLVISYRPAVLANVPKEGTESAYEKVAFMGQVPVKVMGIVERGDYIIPSGRKDGFGRAVKASDLRPEQYQQIVGIAWSSSDTGGFNHVNVAVGLNANDVATLVIDQMTEISQLKRQIDNTNRILAELVPGYAESLASIERAPVLPANAASKHPGAYPSSDAALVSVTNDVLTYPELTREDLTKAIQEVEAQMRNNGDNVDEDPFFHRLRTNPVYKEQVMSGLVEGFNEATRRRATER